MKNLRLSIQVTLVFIAAFIITGVLVIFAVTKSAENIFEDIVYQRLEAEGKAIAQTSDAAGFQLESGIAAVQYSSETQTFTASENIGEYADAAAVPWLIGKAVEQTASSGRYVNTIAGKQIFYVVLKYHGFFEVQNHDIFIVMTDSAMKEAMIENLQSQVLTIFLISFLLGYLIVLYWIFKLVRDTRRISSSLKTFGINDYQSKVETPRRDEIGDLVKSIELMRGKIIENEKQKQEIIQGVSHDLKTPIAIIRSHAEALDDGLCEPGEVTKVIESECIRLDGKVTELLNLTRLNYFDLNREMIGDIRMDLLVEETVKRYRHLTKAKFALNLKPVSFFGDRESWRVALQSILDNAVRYAKTKIEITLKNDALAVCNDGPKIDEERLPNIFEVFEKSADGNFGIGLSTVKRTAELFGYTVAAKNTGDGVCFEIFKAMI